jgi:hypothetical protein
MVTEKNEKDSRLLIHRACLLCSVDCLAIKACCFHE